MRRFLILLLTVAGVAVTVVVALVIYMATADLAPLVEKYSNTLIGRPVRLASLSLGLGSNLHISARDVRLPAGIDPKLPDLAKAGRVDADVRLFPLLTGRLVIQSLTIDNLAVTLVRDTDGIGNWATSRTAPHENQGKAKRTTLPPLLNATLRNADITYVGTDGKPFPTHIEALQLHTPGPANPVEFGAEGSMDHVPLTVNAVLQSFNNLQDFTKPFSGKLVLSSERNTLTYEGTVTDPLNLAGLDGTVDLDAPALSSLANSFGMAIPAGVASSSAGHLTLQNSDWHLHEVHGTLQDAEFTGSADYLAGAPPTLASAVHFGTLDLDSIAGKSGSGGSAKFPNVPAHPSVLLDVQLDAQSVAYSGITLSDLNAHLVTKPGRATLEQAQFGVAGGRVSASGAAEAGASGPHLTGSASADGIDVGQVSRAAGSSSPSMHGPLSGQMQFDLTGSTLQDALGHGQIAAAVSMAGGTVSRKLVRMAKASIRALWTDGGETTPLNCMLAAAHVHDGSGVVHPVQVETPIGTLAAWGRVNLLQQTIDMTLQSQGETSGGLALDVPIHITGPLANPDFQPSTGLLTDDARPRGSAPWPPEINSLIQGSACSPG